MFGSFYAVNPVIRPQVFAFLDFARSRGAILYYDVNFRSSHANEVMKVTPNILENLEFADVVRGSKEISRMPTVSTVRRSRSIARTSFIQEGPSHWN